MMIVFKLADGRVIRIRQPNLSGPVEVVLLSDAEGNYFNTRKRIKTIEIQPNVFSKLLFELLGMDEDPLAVGEELDLKELRKGKGA